MRLAFACAAGALVLGGCLVNTREDEEHGVGGSISGPSGGTAPSGGQGGTGKGGRGSGGGGNSTGGSVTTGGATTGGATTGGVSGTSGTAGTPSGGSGGSGTCVENLACQLEPLPATGDIHQDCVNRINQFRAECACLPPLERWTEGEACANQMAEYDGNADEAHAGFRANLCEGGSAQNECPGWDSETQVIDGCLQSMWDEGPPPTSTCNDSCFQMHGHFINMTNSDYSRVACGFYTTPGGEVWALQNFRD